MKSKYTCSFSKKDNEEKWYLIDAENQTLGRLASYVAARIRGKYNPKYTPSSDLGDNIIIINADKVYLTGNKYEDKKYYRHSGYIGGLKTTTARKLLEDKPENLIKYAVKGMLPKNKLGRSLNKKLRIYTNNYENQHKAQKPEILKVNF